MKIISATRGNGQIALTAGILIAFVLCLVVLKGGSLRYLTYATENMRLWMQPSAAIAFDFANIHFSALNPAEYDVERAELLYRETLRLDPNHNLAHQQLARTLFVRSNLAGALVEINSQFTKHPNSNASAYYIRALIYGFMGVNESAANDYRAYIEREPSGWYAYNDLAWILLRQEKYGEALSTIDHGLSIAPENAWLLTGRTSALYELGRFVEARDTAQRALVASQKVTPEEWVAMYKGNDPATIPSGMAQMIQANKSNLEKIELMLASSSNPK